MEGCSGDWALLGRMGGRAAQRRPLMIKDTPVAHHAAPCGIRERGRLLPAGGLRHYIIKISPYLVERRAEVA